MTGIGCSPRILPVADSAFDRILALGEKTSRYSEADLARIVGVSRERIRQLKARLPNKPVNSRQWGVPGYGRRVEGEFGTAMRRGIDRLVALVDARGADECWPWLGAKVHGYGVLGPGRHYVHRLIYEREHGPIPSGMLVVHKLEGRPCCNPRHLALASARERVWRACREGTRTRISDELRRLTPEQVRAIRRAYAKLPRARASRRGRKFERVLTGRAAELAARYGIRNMSLFGRVATGRAGAWILVGRP